MIKAKLFLMAIVLIASYTLSAQGVAINNDGSPADGSAMLDVKSTDMGILIPRMTDDQRDAITTPATGLMIFQTDETAGFYYYDGSAWKEVGGDSTWTLSGNNLYSTPSGNIGIGIDIPTEKLDVNGNVKIRGSIDASGSRQFGTFAFVESTLAHTAVHNCILHIQNASNIANSQANIQFASGKPAHGRARISATHDAAAGLYNGNLSLEVRNGTTSYIKAINIRSSGNVGIGTTEPTQKLSVAGTIESTTGGVKFPDGTVQTTAASGGTGLPTTANAGDMVYWNGTAWVTVAATVNEGATLQMISGVPTWTGGTPPPVPAVIGDFRDGGVVFYVDATGQHGLVCAVSDQSTGAEWGCYGNAISGADGTAIGTGAQNTIDIEAGCTTDGIAADICANLSLNGYTDWFLPSKDELNEMYSNKATINATAIANGGSGFGNSYWSSTEYNSNYAWKQGFYDGAQSSSGKNYAGRVRAVRAF